MFNENEDWNDEQDAQILCKTVLNTEKTDRNTNLKSKAVGKKSLLRTLQTLGSGPEWTSNNYEQKDSDSETEAAPSPSKKKKNRKKRKHLKKSEEQQEDGQMVMEEKPSSQKKKKGNKPGTPKANGLSADETMDKTNTESPQANVNKPQNSEKLSRQQWKNKMKNKRKCKNKFLQNKPEEDVNKANEQEPKGEIKSDSLSNNNNCENISDTRSLEKRKDRKLLKRNNPDDDTDGFTTAKKKKQQKKERSGKADEDSFKGSAAVSNQKAAELQVEVRNDQLQFATRRQKLELSKEQSLKRQKLQKILLRHEAEQHETPVDQKEPLAPPEEEVKQSRSDSFRARMEQRLEASRFRYINELLYSTSSGEAKRMFQQDPQAFKIYHKGYTAQVQRWPANPVDQIISYIQKKPSSLVIADFGCGDCKIARSVKNKVHSYDLAATCQLVTVCDMANVPLGDSSVDIAVFCLSLMGTNLADFLAEANRVLKMGGILKIAEVSSRFDNVRNFITALARLGFKMTSKDTENSHFYSFEFVKTGNAPKNTVKFGLQLKPCLYKKR